MKLLLIILLVSISGCSTITGGVLTRTDSTSLTEEISVTPTFSNTELGAASVFGQLFLPDGTPLRLTTLYLTPGVGDQKSAPIILVGPNLEKGDYLENTDSEAFFEFSNVKPGTYYLVVSSTNSYHYFLDGTAPISISVEANHRLDLGRVIVDTR